MSMRFVTSVGVSFSLVVGPVYNAGFNTRRPFPLLDVRIDPSLAAYPVACVAVFDHMLSS
uniref:Uncharacterized protein n=1 Tax=Leersia perrieri TaxID=77586 RepID=A0A0D9VXG6_9ORYZ